MDSPDVSIEAGPDDEAVASLRSLLRVVGAQEEGARQATASPHTARTAPAPTTSAPSAPVPSAPAPSTPAPSALPASPDWSHLVARLQGAARQSREIEAQAQDQDQRVQKLLDRVRIDMRGASERAELAETRMRETQARADAQALVADERIRLAEERAEAAEARAHAAEAWLTRVHETVLAEFDGLPEPGTP